MDEPRVAGGTPLLFCMASAWTERNWCSDGCRAEPDFPWSLISFLPGMRQLQSGSVGYVLCDFSRHGFFRPARDLVWLRLPRAAANRSSASPPKGACSLVADSSPFLSLGQHAWIVVHRHDYILADRSRGVGPLKVGTDRKRTVDDFAAEKLVVGLGCECCPSLCESFWRASRALSA